MADTLPAVDAAAEWWCRFVRGTYGSRDNGGDGMTALLALATQPPAVPQPEENVAAFKAALVAEVERQLSASRYATIGTDYGPDYELLQCIEAAGVNGSWPWKTHMTVTREFVSVREGYGAREKAIFGERACRACTYTVERVATADRFGYSYVESEPMGVDIDFPTGDPYPDGLGHWGVRLTDRPCSTCDGTKVLRAPATA